MKKVQNKYSIWSVLFLCIVIYYGFRGICGLIRGQDKNRIISCYLVLIVPYFVDKMGDYGRNNTRRTGGVCDLDLCNVLYNTIWMRAIILFNDKYYAI